MQDSRVIARLVPSHLGLFLEHGHRRVRKAFLRAIRCGESYDPAAGNRDTARRVHAAAKTFSAMMRISS